MTNESQIKEAVFFLLQSARERETEQGIVIYTKIIEMLEQAEDNSEIDEILRKLNRSLAGIEAHGFFTDPEFEKVLFLRNAEV